MLPRPRISVVIPYFNRLPYIERVLQSLAEQDAATDQLEIVIVSLEYSAALLKVVSSLPEGLKVRCVLVREPWNVSRARNVGFANASGEVVLLLDSDMLLPRSFMSKLIGEHDPSGKRAVVVCQMLNYSAYTDVLTEELGEYSYYRDTYLARNCREGLRNDSRWDSARSIPWSLCWTALLAVPRDLVARHSLYFDETFTGWGAEDLEWGYRLQQEGISLEFADDLWGIHLPHFRNVRKNSNEQELNYDRFLRKWPCFEVELVTRFGDAFANEHFREFVDVRQLMCGRGQSVNVVEIAACGARRLAIGAICDKDGRWLNCTEILDDPGAVVTRWAPLLGLRLPYPSKYADASYVLPAVRNAPSNVQTLIESEVDRVS